MIKVQQNISDLLEKKSVRSGLRAGSVPESGHSLEKQGYVLCVLYIFIIGIVLNME